MTPEKMKEVIDSYLQCLTTNGQIDRRMVEALFREAEAIAKHNADQWFKCPVLANGAKFETVNLSLNLCTFINVTPMPEGA